MQLYKNFCKETFDENGVINTFKLDFPETYNFGYDVVDKMAELAPNDEAVVWTNPAKEEKIFTFADISRLSNKAANVFKKYGIKKGDRVISIMKRNYEYWYIAPALHKLGAVLIPASCLLTEKDIAFRVNAVNIKAAICSPDDEIAETMLKVAKLDNSLENVFVPRRDVEGAINLTEEIENASEELEREDVKAVDPMLLYFTSGTTGYPKAVIHDATYSLAHILTAKYWQCVKEKGRHLTVADTGWAKASWGKLYGAWLCGCAVMVYDFDNFSPGKLLRVVEKFKVTSFCAPPTAYRYFIKRNIKKYDLSSLEHITTAGEALNPEVFHQIYEQTGLKIMEGFGQTESVVMLANLKGTTAKPGSMGKPTPLYDIHIVNDEGEELGVGETGEVVVYPPKDGSRQYGVFTDYFGDHERYERVWRGGVYHTGDTAYKDEDGYFWYVGRADDLIKSRGYRVGPFEVENVLMEHPDVLECAVVGVPDKDRGQAIKAIVKLADGVKADKDTENEIKTFCNKKMASYKWIQYIEFVEEFPKTTSGKIMRKDLRESHPSAEG